MNEEINAKNILAIKAHSETTRAIAREVQAELVAIRTEMLSIRAQNDVLQEQLRTLQVRVFSGGATSGDYN